MMKYSEIKLTDEEKKILEWFKGQEYNIIGRTTNYGFLEVLDDAKDIRCNLKPMRKPFEFIENGEHYEIEKLLNPSHEPKKVTVWDLESGDKYWLVGHNGKAYWQIYKNSEIDLETRSQGNAFLTKEEAEFEAKRREVVTKVRKYSRPFNPNESNWVPYYGYQGVNAICICSEKYFQYGCDYFATSKDIKTAIEEVGEEDFKKYYLGVTENA